MKIISKKNIIYVRGLDWYSFHDVVLRLMDKNINFTTTIDYDINITNIGINRAKNLLKGLD
jgi:30S ribosomal protein S6